MLSIQQVVKIMRDIENRQKTYSSGFGYKIAVPKQNINFSAIFKCLNITV